MIDGSPIPGKYSEFLMQFFQGLPKIEFEGVSRAGSNRNPVRREIDPNQFSQLPRTILPDEELLFATNSDQPEPDITDAFLIYFDQINNRPTFKYRFIPQD